MFKRKCALLITSIMLAAAAPAASPALAVQAASYVQAREAVSSTLEKPANFVERNGSTYYITSNGTMKTGWIFEKGNWYYFSKKDGRMVKHGNHPAANGITAIQKEISIRTDGLPTAANTTTLPEQAQLPQAQRPFRASNSNSAADASCSAQSPPMWLPPRNPVDPLPHTTLPPLKRRAKRVIQPLHRSLQKQQVQVSPRRQLSPPAAQVLPRHLQRQKLQRRKLPKQRKHLPPRSRRLSEN